MPRNPEEIPERFKVWEDADKLVFTDPGDPLPEIKIRLPNGMLVPRSIYGDPPPGLSINEIQTWVADRSLQLMSGGDPNWPVDTTGDE